MDRNILELIYAISDDFETNEEKTSSNLFRLTKITANKVWNKDFDEIIKIKQRLDEELATEKITDFKSYNLGKAHALTELIGSLKHPYEVHEIVKRINDNEKEILVLIYEEKDITPSEIMSKLDKSKQSISNILSKLRSKDLVKVYAVGRHKWYSLSLKGKDVVQEFLNALEKKVIQEKESQSTQFIEEFSISIVEHIPEFNNLQINNTEFFHERETFKKSMRHKKNLSNSSSLKKSSARDKTHEKRDIIFEEELYKGIKIDHDQFEESELVYH